MNDRELLEMAAKAADLHIDFNDALDFSGPSKYFDYGNGGFWNPLIDDGDALRLAVKLELELDLLTGEKRATTAYYETASAGAWKVHEPHANDPYAATRRAIVRAAAAVGAGIAPFPTVDEIKKLAGEE